MNETLAMMAIMFTCIAAGLLACREEISTAIRRRLAAPKPVQVMPKQLTVQSYNDKLFDDSMAIARTAWRLPADYFRQWDPRTASAGLLYPDVEYVLNLCFDGIISQSPLSKLMNATHDSMPPEVQQRMWESPEFVNIVMHVFNDISKDDIPRMQASAAWGISHGYWRPHGKLVLEAIDRDLVGCELPMSELLGNGHVHRTAAYC